MGELRRMTQFKEKGGEKNRCGPACSPTRSSWHPDILLYDAERVPVGDDQRQHLELTRDLAIRFNSPLRRHLGRPRGGRAQGGARVMDLQEPTRKMSKSVSSPLGTVLMLDPPEEIDAQGPQSA